MTTEVARPRAAPKKKDLLLTKSAGLMPKRLRDVLANEGDMVGY